MSWPIYLVITEGLERQKLVIKYSHVKQKFDMIYFHNDQENYTCRRDDVDLQIVNLLFDRAKEDLQYRFTNYQNIKQSRIGVFTINGTRKEDVKEEYVGLFKSLIQRMKNSYCHL